MRVLEPMALLLLAEAPAHGYALVEQLASAFGLQELQAQTVYRTLQAMETAGWVAADWDMESAQGPPRKVYQVTPLGLSMLESWVTEVSQLQAMLGRFMDSYATFRQTRSEIQERTG